MNVFETRTELSEAIPSDKKVGFVPTMGALHEGHMSLVRESVARGLHTVASIFVNPTQFNDPKDYEKYPVDTTTDLAMLEAAGCDAVFLPQRDEVYPSSEEAKRYEHEFGFLETRFEGAYRPGHFKGVGQVVHILFDIVQPDVAFFGEKDFQQLQVIRSLVKKMNASIEVVGMPTVRELDGLAMSSRNRRLSKEEREESPVLYECLQYAKLHWGGLPAEEIKAYVAERIDATRHMRLEYFDIIDPARFEPLTASGAVPAHAVIAAYAGDVRLIDNLQLA